MEPSDSYKSVLLLVPLTLFILAGFFLPFMTGAAMIHVSAVVLLLSVPALPIGANCFAYAMATPSEEFQWGTFGRILLIAVSVMLMTAFLYPAIPMLLAPIGAKVALAAYSHDLCVAIGLGIVDAVLAAGTGLLVFAFASHQGEEDTPIGRENGLGNQAANIHQIDNRYANTTPTPASTGDTSNTVSSEHNLSGPKQRA